MRWWLVLLSVLGAAGTAGAADIEETRATLKGLQGVWVIVEGFDENAKRAGFDDKTFQTDVELKLRMAGIKVLTEDEWPQAPGMPYLYVNVTALHTKPGQIAPYYLDVALNQAVNLARNGAPASAVTWSYGALGNGDLQYIRAAVKDDVDTFINAWLSVNPKK